MVESSLQKLEFRAMGCRMLAAVDAAGPQATSALAQVPRRFETWEQCLSRFRDDSELAELNRRSGQPVRVSDTMWQVTRLAVESAFLSGGLVTPTVLDALEAAGYDHSMAEPAGAAAPVHVALRSTPVVPPWHTIKLDSRKQTITLPPGIRLDLAGVAKGWAADQAAKELARVAPALVDASGDIAVSGPRSDGSGWPIGIENPLGGSEDLPLLMLDRGGVATSTLHYRRWMRGHRWQHHIIDPRTGEPAETDVLSATAIAPSTSEAEVAAKVLIILGSGEGMAWIEQREQLAALIILKSGQVQTSNRLKYYVWG